MILLLGALECEITRIPPLLSGSERHDWRGFEVYRGMLEGRSVAVARIGAGKALAAAVTQRLVQEYRPRAVLLTGIAGALVADLAVGDLVLGRDCVQHDLDASRFGFVRGEIPYSRFRVLPCDSALLECAATAAPLRGRARVGRILSGDRFLDREEKRRLAVCGRELSGTVVDMESAGVALVCALNAIPLLIVRTVSDTLEGAAPKRFRRLLESCGDTAAAYFRALASAGALPPGAGTSEIGVQARRRARSERETLREEDG